MKKVICIVLSILMCTGISFADNRKYDTLEVTELGYILSYYTYMQDAGVSPSLDRLTDPEDSISMFMMSDFSSITFMFKDSEISEAVMLCSGDGTASSGADIMLNMLVSIMIFDPSLREDSAALNALLEIMSKGEYETEYCQYSYSKSEQFGSLLTITP